ncbi:MAG: CoA-binding protein [Candidatus Zixiibacteriota bacterium]|nr:MAG: CoA-binding protein [candidate division Zixibacteria bacterium]
MDENIREFLQSKSIAVIGVSATRTKFGALVYRALKRNGFKVYGVNPSLASCDGDTCYARLADIPEPVEGVLVVVRPERVKGLISEAARGGIERIWFQQGPDHTKLANQASEAGMTVVADKCILMYAKPVAGIHRVHRFFARLFGKY